MAFTRSDASRLGSLGARARASADINKFREPLADTSKLFIAAKILQVATPYREAYHVMPSPCCAARFALSCNRLMVRLSEKNKAPPGKIGTSADISEALTLMMFPGN